MNAFTVTFDQFNVHSEYKYVFSNFWMILYFFNTLCKQATVRLRDCITRQKNGFKKSFFELS